MAVDPQTERTLPQRSVSISDSAAWAMVEAAPDALVMVDASGIIELVNKQAETLFGYKRSDLLGKPVETLLPDRLGAAHSAHRNHYQGAPTVRSMGTDLELLARRSDGKELPVEVSLSPVSIDGQVRTIAAVRDITKRVATEAREHRQRERTQATLEALADVRSTLLAKHSTDEILELICEHARALVRADSVSYLRPSKAGASLVQLAHVGQDLSSSAAETVIAAKSAAIAGDGTAWRSGDDDSHGGIDEACGGLQPTMVVPVVGNDGVAGVLVILRGIDEDHFQDADLLLLTGFASNAATALQFDAARKQRQRTELLQDRERIGRDMHDLVIGRLFATGMSLQATLARTSDPDTKKRIEAAVSEIDTGIKEIRTSIYGLHSQQDWGNGVRGEILAIAADMKPVLGFEPQVTMNGPIDAVAENRISAALAALREALTNASKHAESDKVDILVEASEDRLTMTITDDGIGFSTAALNSQSPNAPQLTSNGLRNMRARAEALGGYSAIESSEGAGTTVEWSVPLNS